MARPKSKRLPSSLDRDGTLRAKHSQAHGRMGSDAVNLAMGCHAAGCEQSPVHRGEPRALSAVVGRSTTVARSAKERSPIPRESTPSRSPARKLPQRVARRPPAHGDSNANGATTASGSAETNSPRYHGQPASQASPDKRQLQCPARRRWRWLLTANADRKGAIRAPPVWEEQGSPKHQREDWHVARTLDEYIPDSPTDRASPASAMPKPIPCRRWGTSRREQAASVTVKNTCSCWVTEASGHSLGEGEK